MNYSKWKAGMAACLPVNIGIQEKRLSNNYIQCQAALEFQIAYFMNSTNTVVQCEHCKFKFTILKQTLQAHISFDTTRV